MSGKVTPQRLMSPQELADYIGGNVTIQTVYHWNSTGTGPAFMRLGKHVRYRVVDVERWLQRHRSDNA